MNRSEAIRFDPRHYRDLERLVREGEGLNLEFKRKASHPDKIVREVIAFANTQGGTLLIGVDDNGTIPGVRYPEEESLLITKELQAHCRPSLDYRESIIAASNKKYVVRFDIPSSPRRPHVYKDKDQSTAFVRVNDMTLQASREMTEIVRRSRKSKDIRFTFGAPEKQLMEYLDQYKTISLEQYRILAGLNRYQASKKLVLLVLANVIRITPTEKGDLFSRI